MSGSGQPTHLRNGNTSDPTEHSEVATQRDGTDLRSPSGSVGMTAPSTSGDEESGSTPTNKIQKRIVHNAVERRRKVKINNYIFTLAKHLPNRDGRKWSKNETLEKTVEYIEEIKTAHEKLMLGQLDEVQAGEFQRMKSRIEDLEQKNRTYAKLLEIAGIPLNGEPGAPWPATLGDHVNPEHLYLNDEGELSVRTPAEQAAAEVASRRGRRRLGSGTLERTTPSSSSSSSCVSSPAAASNAVPPPPPVGQRGVEHHGDTANGVAAVEAITTSGATAVTQALSAAPIMSTNLHQVTSSSPSTTTLLPTQMSLLNFGGGANGLNLLQPSTAATATMQPMITINDQGIPVLQMVTTTGHHQTGAGGQVVLNAGSSSHGLMQTDLSYLQQALCGAGFVHGDSSNGVLTVNGPGSELPSALMLPNGQIIPVVREPSLLYQNASSGNGGLVVTGGGSATGVVSIQSPQLPTTTAAAVAAAPTSRPSSKSDSSLMTLLPRQPAEQSVTSDSSTVTSLPTRTDAPQATKDAEPPAIQPRHPTTTKAKVGKMATKKVVAAKRPRDIKPKSAAAKKSVTSKKSSMVQPEPLVTSAALARAPTPSPPSLPPPSPPPPPVQPDFSVEAPMTTTDEEEGYRPASTISRSGSRCLGGANDILARATESIFSNSLSDVSSSPNPGYYDDGGGGREGANQMDLMQGLGGGDNGGTTRTDNVASPLPGQFSSMALSTSSADSGIASGGDNDASRVESSHSQLCRSADHGEGNGSGELLGNLVNDRLPDSAANGDQPVDSDRRRRHQQQKRSSCEQESLVKRSKTSPSISSQEDGRQEGVRLSGTKQPFDCGSVNSQMTGVEMASEPVSVGGGGGASGVSFVSISQLASSSAAVSSPSSSSSSKAPFFSLDGSTTSSPMCSISPMHAGANFNSISTATEVNLRGDDVRFAPIVSSSASHPPPTSFSSHQPMFGPSVGNFSGQFQYGAEGQVPRPPFSLSNEQQAAACSMTQTSSSSRSLHGVGHHRNQKPGTQSSSTEQAVPPFAPQNPRFQSAPPGLHHPQFANTTNNPMELSLHQSLMRGGGPMGGGLPFPSPGQVSFSGQSYPSAPLSHIMTSSLMTPQRLPQSGGSEGSSAKSKNHRRSIAEVGDDTIMSPPAAGPPPRLQRSPLTGAPLGHDSSQQQQQRGNVPLFPAPHSMQRMHPLLHHSPQGGNGAVSPVGQQSPVAGGGRSNLSASPHAQHQLPNSRSHHSTSPVQHQSQSTATSSPGAPSFLPRRSPHAEAPLRSPTYHLDPYAQPYLFAGQKQLSHHPANVPATSMAPSSSSRASIYSAESLIQSGERPNCAQEGQARTRSSPHVVQQHPGTFGGNSCGNRQPSHVNGGQTQSSGLPYLAFQQSMSGGPHQQAEQQLQQHSTPSASSGGNKSGGGAGWSLHQQSTSGKPRGGGGSSSQTSPQAAHSQPNFSFSLMPSGGSGDVGVADSRQQMPCAPSQNHQIGVSPHHHQQQQLQQHQQQQQQSPNGNYPLSNVRPTYQTTSNSIVPVQQQDMHAMQHQHKEGARLSAPTMSFPPVSPHFFGNHRHPQLGQARPGLPHHGSTHSNPFTEMYHAAVHGANLNHGGNVNVNALGPANSVPSAGSGGAPCKQPRGLTAKQEAKKSKQSQPSKRKLQQLQLQQQQQQQQQQLQHQSYNVEEVNLSNSIFETGGRSLTPYFAVPNLSPPRNEVPTYLPHPPNPLFNNGVGSRGPAPHQSASTGKAAGDLSSPPPYNVFTGGANGSRGGGGAATQGLNLNFQPGFGVAAHHPHHHLHGAAGPNQMTVSSQSSVSSAHGGGGAHAGSNVSNFNLSNIFPDMGSGGGGGNNNNNNNEGLKFHHGNHLLGSVARSSDGGHGHLQQQHHHHHPSPAGAYPTSSSNRGMLHNGGMSINTLLGHHPHHNPHGHPGAPQVSMNNMTAGAAPAFHGHAPPAFGNVPTLNFALHEH